jgi:DNA repair protein RecO (recombination protein O)
MAPTVASGRSQARGPSPAYVLHSHDWSESSLILDLFCREQGRVVAIAKGAKRPYSQLRPVLMPFQRIAVGFGAKRSDDAEVWLLRQAEWAGGEAFRGGDALLPAFYLNELLMRLLPRHEAHAVLFEAYADTLKALAEPGLLQAALRAFELVLLRQLGHLPDLSLQTLDAAPVQPGLPYELHAELGVRPAHWLGEVSQGAAVLNGSVLLAMEEALSDAWLNDPRRVRPGHSPLPSLMAACMPALGELKAITRALLHYHLGSHTLRTRQLMMDIQQP